MRSSVKKLEIRGVGSNQNYVCISRNIFPSNKSHITTNEEPVLAWPLFQELNSSCVLISVKNNKDVSNELNFVEPVLSSSTNYTLSTPPFTPLED